MSDPLGHGSTAGIGSEVGSEASGALVSFNPEPVEGFPATRSAIVRVSWTPLRREPTHAAEMVSQLIMGEVIELLDAAASGWLRVRAPDGYEGHVSRGALRLVSKRDAARWAAAADGYSLGTALHLRTAREESGTTGESRDIAGAPCAPWGARLPRAQGGGLLLPDGRTASPTRPDHIVFPPERALDFVTDPAAAAETARRWIGAPYVWGGRIREAVDCSGLVQAVYALHGFRLPRDSRDQFAAGPGGPVSEHHAGDGQAGDLWFFAWDGRPISHVGICLGGGAMIHASETRGCVAIDRLGATGFGERLAAGLTGSMRPAG